MKKTTRRKADEIDAIEHLVGFIEEHLKGVLIALCLAIVLLPLGTWLIYSLCLRGNSCGGISADEFLAYAGAVFTGLMSLFVAAIALVQGKRAAEAEAERESEKRRSTVRPSLHIEVEPCGERIFKLTIRNNGKYAALDVYLFTEPFARVINGGKEFKRQFSVGAAAQNIFAVDESDCKLRDGMPEKLYFAFGDIDNNVWGQEFHYTADGYFCREGLTLL